MPDAAIEIEDVTKVFRLYREKMQSAKERIIKFGRVPYDDFYALRNVSFEVPEGRTLGLLGHNGSGKSTLLKMVAGTMRPSTGTIRTRGRLAALLELGAGFHGDLTGRENVYLNGSILGFNKADVDRIFDDVVDFAGVQQFIDMQVKHYSSGMTARLGFAMAVHVDPDIILVDEVLSVGDESFQRKCLERFREFQAEGRTILVVTHAADLVRMICDSAAVLDQGELVTVDEPGPAIRAFRESLINRGIALEGELHDPEAEAEEQQKGRKLSKAVRFTDVRVVYPDSDESYVLPGHPVQVRCRYTAPQKVDDVVFAINVHDEEGRLVLGVNTDLVGDRVDFVKGDGEVVFDLGPVPLLDGDYDISVGIHTHDLGEEYDHRENLDRFQVMNPTRVMGRSYFAMNIEHHPA